MVASEGEVTKLPDRVAVEEVERLLQGLVGIDACRVVANEWGALEEIHVLSEAERHPKQVVRDVESALAARWKLRVDHKKISVAQLSGGTEGEIRPAVPPASLRLESLRTHNRLDDSSMEVSLVLREEAGRAFEGSATIGGGRGNRLSVFARAAVAAVNGYLQGESSVELENVRLFEMAGREIVVCLLARLNRGGEISAISGSSVVHGDRGSAAVNAVLAAIIRSADTTRGGVGESLGTLRDESPMG
ncbi:MAG: hypothetical protein ACLFS8_02115 [Clostridia bacterium]